MSRNPNEAAMKNRMKGALVGVAIGDALGAPVEFMPPEQIRRTHGQVTEMLGGGWLNLKPGAYTDDTEMTMAVADGIVESPADPVPAVGRRFVDWYEHTKIGTGITCTKAITYAMEAGAASLTAEDWREIGRKTDAACGGQSGGNGALMRTVYPALFYGDKKRRDQVVADIATMTHLDKDSTEICLEYTHAIHAAIFGAHPISYITNRYYFPHSAPNGYVVSTWSNVVEAFLETDSFEEALIDAVNRGGDADTIGAITGGLAGACYGYKAIPQRWICKLDPILLARIDHLVDAAYQAVLHYYQNEFKVPAGLKILLEGR